MPRLELYSIEYCKKASYEDWYKHKLELKINIVYTIDNVYSRKKRKEIQTTLRKFKK